MVLRLTAPHVPLGQIIPQPSLGTAVLSLGKYLGASEEVDGPGTLGGIQEWVSGLRSQHPTTKYHDLAYRCL